MVSRPARERKAPTSIYADAKAQLDASNLSDGFSAADSDSDSDMSEVDENNVSTNTVKTVKASKPKAAKKSSKASKPRKAAATGGRAVTGSAKLAANETNVLLTALLSRTVSVSSAVSDLVERHASDSNAAQCELVNLLFRCVGGSAASEIDPKAFVLDDIGDDDWVAMITNVVADMQSSAGPSTLVTVTKKQTAAGKKSLDAYKQFWFALADAALAEGKGALSGSSGPTSARLDVPLVRSFIARITELVGVGQPDIRYAASVAAFEMGRALLGKVVGLGEKLAVAERQKAAASGKRADALAKDIASLKTVIAEMEELVTGPIFSVVFMHRYRDSNEVVRAMCVEYLAAAVVVRPQVFLCDKYLKYFGWLISDPSSLVREAALDGLNRPFVVANSSPDSGVDLELMTNVAMKFLKRIAGCAIDKEASVQPHAMTLLLSLLREGFLDELEDDALWDQINFKALDPSATPEMRRTALEFIIEQLEAFDDDEEAEGAVGVTGGDAERIVVLKIDALASWVAHAFTGGDEKQDLGEMNLQLTDLLVESLKAIPEHSYITTDWSSMLRAINEDSVATTANNNTADRATDAAKQLVLMRMLMASVKMEVGKVGAADFLLGLSFKAAAVNKKSETAHTKLSVELLKALPALFNKFSGDSRMLREIATLPRFLIQSVFSVSQRKNDFNSTLKALSDLFVKSTDDEVLVQAAMSLQHFITGDHSRVNEAKNSLQKVVDTLSKKVKELSALKLTGAKKKGGKGMASKDTEFAFGLCLKQLRVLGKYCDVGAMVGDDEVEAFLESVATASKTRIVDSKGENQFLAESGAVVDESMAFAVSVLGWKVAAIHSVENAKMAEDEAEDEKMLGADEDEEDDSTDDGAATSLVAVRDLVVGMCQEAFDLKSDNEDDETFGMKGGDDSDFAVFKKLIQTSACVVAGDLRSLCAKNLKDSSSKVLRAVAFENDAALLAGMAKCVKRADKEGDDFISKKLMPVIKCLIANWDVVNRREAGIVLSNITGSGVNAGKAVAAMAKVAKNKDGVKLLEAHMASLRQSYEDWQEATPDMLEEGKATDDELDAYQQAEESHEELYSALRSQASRLSQSLGVGKLSNKKMEPAMVGFVKEGMRYAFSCPKKGADDDQDLFGDRLSFLGPLKMYLNWVKKNPAQKAEVLAEYQERSAEFKRHLFFDEEAHAEILKVFGDDFEAVLKSRKVVEIEEEEELLEEPVSQKRKSTGNQSVSSASKGSSNLESVKESDEESPEHVPGVFDESDGKRRRSTRAQ